MLGKEPECLLDNLGAPLIAEESASLGTRGWRWVGFQSSTMNE
jgi:hypothetical protein